jgi:hypothetical protein
MIQRQVFRGSSGAMFDEYDGAVSECVRFATLFGHVARIFEFQSR